MVAATLGRSHSYARPCSPQTRKVDKNIFSKDPYLIKWGWKSFQYGAMNGNVIHHLQNRCSSL